MFVFLLLFYFIRIRSFQFCPNSGLYLSFKLVLCAESSQYLTRFLADFGFAMNKHVRKILKVIN